MHGAKRRRAKCGKAMPDTYHFKMEWGTKRGGRRGRAPSRRRQPFTCKSAIFLPSLPSSLPLDFLSRPPVRRLSSTNFFLPSFLPLSFTLFFAARTFSHFGARDDRGRTRNSKQRYARKDDFNTLPRERARRLKVGFY